MINNPITPPTCPSVASRRSSWCAAAKPNGANRRAGQSRMRCNQSRQYRRQAEYLPDNQRRPTPSHAKQYVRVRIAEICAALCRRAAGAHTRDTGNTGEGSAHPGLNHRVMGLEMGAVASRPDAHCESRRRTSPFAAHQAPPLSKNLTSPGGYVATLLQIIDLNTF